MAKALRNPEDDFDDLYGIDLRALDLDHIELSDQETPRHYLRYVSLVVLVALIGTIAWLPESHFYLTSPYQNTLFFLLCAGAAVAGLGLSRVLWPWVQELVDKRASKPHLPEKTEPPSALARWTMLLSAVFGAVAIVIATNSDGYSDSPGSWFWSALGALAVGGLLSRWLVAQAAVGGERRRILSAIQWPWWTKWVTLAILLAGVVLIAVFGADVDGRSVPGDGEFGLGGAGLVLGVLGAIWLTRRFDEVEQRVQNDRRLRRTRSESSR